MTEDQNIIQFPGQAINIVPSESKDIANRLVVGPVNITCAHCGEVATANLTNMVFKTLDCYCLGCGAFYRITNPAFKAPTTKKP